MVYERQRDDYTISTDPGRLDLALVHGFLSRSYWAQGISFSAVQRSIAGSLAFGVYHGKQQVGFARVVTDYATIAYLADLFIVENERGKHLGTWLVEAILAHPQLQGLRRWMLATRDAHEFYRRFGFSELSDADRFMERRATGSDQQHTAEPQGGRRAEAQERRQP